MYQPDVNGMLRIVLCHRRRLVSYLHYFSFLLIHVSKAYHQVLGDILMLHILIMFGVALVTLHESLDAQCTNCHKI